jgi:hypothetical protein
LAILHDFAESSLRHLDVALRCAPGAARLEAAIKRLPAADKHRLVGRTAAAVRRLLLA